MRRGKAGLHGRPAFACVLAGLVALTRLHPL
jgi:hypothetical protein